MVRARGMWIVLALLGCEDFPNAPTSTVTLTPSPGAQWPQDLFVKDTSILTVEVKGAADTVITGLQLLWLSSDSSILAIRPVDSVPPATHEDSLLSERSVRIVAQRRGTATITVRTIQPGIEPEALGWDVRIMERWKSVSAGNSHSCGITIDDDAFCWGAGLLGNGSAVGSAFPVPVARGLKFRSLSAGNGHTCGVLLDGTVHCWGSNTYGELGTGAAGDQALPVLLSGISILDSVFAGDGYVCGVSATMSAFCWGDNFDWQLGDGFIRPFSPPNPPDPPFDNCSLSTRWLCSRTPRQVRDRGSLSAQDGVPLLLSNIAPAVKHTCGLYLSGAAVCWGDGSVELGSSVELTTDSNSTIAFVSVPGGLSFQQITAGDRHTCAVRRSVGFVYCWGFNARGQLGRTTPDSTCQTQSIPPIAGCTRSPKVAFDLLPSVAVDAGGSSSCALGSDSAAYCWGSNEFGQLGDPSIRGMCDAGTICRTIAVKVAVGGEPFVSLSVGARHACAVTKRGAAICWGDSANGQIGKKNVKGTGLVGPTRVDEPQ